MTKQILKGVTMLTLIVGMALVTAAVTANAQTGRVNSDIPFSFVIGNKTLPAGKYVVSRATSSGDTLLVSSREAKSAAMRLTQNIDGMNRKTTPRLVFHKYGQTYFLAEVWNGESTGRQLLPSKREKELAKAGSAIAKADSQNSGYQVVEVIAAYR